MFNYNSRSKFLSYDFVKFLCVSKCILLDYELIGEPFHQTLHTSGSDEACYKIYGYRKNSKRLFLYHFVSLLLAGIPYVIFNMYPKYCAFKYKNCSLSIAEYILGLCMLNYVKKEVYFCNFSWHWYGKLFFGSCASG